jgi:hypothetical protein
MSTITRNLSNIAGANVTNPDANAFTSNSLESYANDAAFEAVFTPQAGSLYWNTTNNLVREYNGTAWQNDKTSFETQDDTTTTGSLQTVTPTASAQVIKFSQGSLASISGIVPSLQKVIYLVNGQGSSITIKNDDPSATVGYRIITGRGSDFILGPSQILALKYDTVDLEWIASGNFATKTELTDHESDTSTHGVGTIVGVTESQTLTNKTLTSPTLIGEVILTHTATENDTYAFELVVNAAGYGDTKALDIVYTTGAIAPGADESVILVSVDETSSTGGSVHAVEVLSTEGSASVYGLKAGVRVGPIIQESGSFANPTTGTNNTASTDVPAMIDGNTGTTTAIFIADNDYIIIGASSPFTEIEFLLQTVVSNQGIQPTFGYSIAGSGQFTAFSPIDGTNGFRNNGVVAWDATDLTNHAVNSDTGTYDIKITRTRNSAMTCVLYYARVAGSSLYSWDSSGNLTINSLYGNLTNATGLPISTGVSGLGSGVATFLATPSSANLAAALTDETGTGANVFGTSPTLVTPTVDDYLILNEESTPGTAGAGTVRIYAKSDKKIYKKDSNGTESELGAGGTSLINYISNPDFETGATTGWATYKDAAAATPADGTGGSPTTLTLSANSSSPMRGSYDFKVAKSAANSQGEGFSYDFTIKTPDKSKKLSISFDLTTNDSNYTAGDVVVYVYDVTNATLITPSTTSLPKVGASTWNITFDSTTSTSYRLIFHWAVTTATAVNLYFDSFIVGPGTTTQGAAVSEWGSYTPTGNFTNGTYTGRYRRVGSEIELKIDIAFTSGAGGTATFSSTQLLNGLGLTLNTSALPNTTDTVLPMGTWAALDTGVNTNYQGNINWYVDTFVLVYGTNTAVTTTAPFSFASGDNVALQLKFPISEWAGNGTVNLGAGAQVEYAYTTDTWDAAGSTTAYGPAGVQMSGALTAARNKTVTWQYPIQATDQIKIELSYDRVTWVDAATIAPYTLDSTGSDNASAGVTLAAGGSSTTSVVRFCRYLNIANDDAPASAWSTSYYWRVRKANPSSPVGFGLASSTASGLVQPRKGQYSLTVSSSVAFSSYNAVGVYYQDQDGNHRLKFNISGIVASGARTGTTLTITGVTFKNRTSYYQACAAFNDAANGACAAYANLNAATITVNHASATTAFYGVSGDVELDSKPSWA